MRNTIARHRSRYRVWEAGGKEGGPLGARGSTSASGRGMEPPDEFAWCSMVKGDRERATSAMTRDIDFVSSTKPECRMGCVLDACLSYYIKRARIGQHAVFEKAVCPSTGNIGRL